MGIIGIVTFALLFIGTVAALFVSLCCAVAELSCALWMILVLVGVIGGLGVVFWSLFVVMTNALNISIIIPQYVIDMIIVVLGNVLQLPLLYEWMSFVHPLRRGIVRMLFVICTIVLILAFVSTVVATSVTWQRDNFHLLHFWGYALLFFSNFLLSSLLLGYGIRILKSHNKHDGFVLLIAQLSIILLCNILRLAFGLYWIFWGLTNYGRQVPGVSGFPNTLFGFPSLVVAFLVALFVYMIPDAIPAFLFLFIVFRHQISARQTRQRGLVHERSLHEIPLLEQGVPRQYEI